MGLPNSPVDPPPTGGTVQCSVCQAAAKGRGPGRQSPAIKAGDWDMEHHLSGEVGA